MSDRKKKYDCGVIQDLLPLYQDNVCSESSKIMVEEHLAECDTCRSLSERLKNTSLDEELVTEKNSILTKHASMERKRTFMIGAFTAGILMIPVIVCLICNLAIGHGLDWFFIVLASLLIVASVTVVPLMVPNHTGLWTLGCFTGSLLLLLLITAIYTHGDWFFLAAIPVIFGLSILFMPYVIYQIPLPETLSRSKGLLVMLWDTVWLYAVIIVCGLHAGSVHYWRPALQITTYCILLPWSIFGIIRYLKLPALTKTGICTMITGIFISFTNDICHLILDGRFHLTIADADFSAWNNDPTINANTYLIILIASIAAGILFICIGQLKRRK